MAKHKIGKRQLLRPKVLASYVPGVRRVLFREQTPRHHDDCDAALDGEDFEDYMSADAEPDDDDETNPLEEVEGDKRWRQGL